MLSMDPNDRPNDALTFSGPTNQYTSDYNEREAPSTSLGLDENVSAPGSVIFSNQPALIAVISASVIIGIGLAVVYVCTCRKYRLTWFQKNVFLTEQEHHERRQRVGSSVTAEGDGSDNAGVVHARCPEFISRGAVEANQTTHLLSPKTPDIGHNATGRWRSLLPGGLRRNTTASTLISSELNGDRYGQNQSQGQGHSEQQPRQGYDHIITDRRMTAITVNYVSLRRCDRQPSSFDSAPSSPTSTTFESGPVGNSLSSATSTIASISVTRQSVATKPPDTETANGLLVNRSKLLERRSCHMGALASRTESEQCRIIVEDVTKLADDERSCVPTTSGVTTSGGVSADSRHSSVSSEAAVTMSSMTRRGSLSPGGPNATTSRRGSNSSWTSWGSGNGSSLVAERDCETQFWVPASVMQRSRAKSLVPPSLDTCSPDVNGGHLNTILVSPVGIGFHDTSMFTFSAVQPGASSMTLLECPPQRRRRSSMHDALDHTQINASLYERPPMLGSNKQLFGNIQEENLGSIQFSVSHDSDTSLLSVQLIQASELAPVDPTSGTVNPFACLRLLPDTKNQLQTRLHTASQSPYFDETFIFEATRRDLRSRTLEIRICHQSADEHVGNGADKGIGSSDKSNNCVCTGQVLLPLDQVDLSETITMWKGISAFEHKPEVVPLGDVMFSLSYLPSAERLTVVVVEARNLRPCNTAPTTKPFNNALSTSHTVKVMMYISGKKYKRRKTSTATKHRDTLHPLWNEALVFSSVTRDQLMNSAQLELIVCGGNGDETIGRVAIGVNSVAGRPEHSHWMDMLNGRPAIAKWHELTPLED